MAGNARGRVERLLATAQTARLYRTDCHLCGGAEPGSIAARAVFPGEVVEVCQGCGAALEDGRAIAERTTLVHVHPPDSP